MIIPGDIRKIPSWVLCGLMKMIQSLTKDGVLGLNEPSLGVNAERTRGYEEEEGDDDDDEEGEQRIDPEDERGVCL